MVELNKTLGLGMEEEEGGFYSVLGRVGVFCPLDPVRTG